MTNAISATSYNPDVSSRLIQRIGTTPTPVLASQTVDPDEGVLKLSGETFLREHRAGSSGARLQAPLASGEVSVQRGHALVKQVCRDNRDDFDLLFNSLGPVWGEERFAAIERIAHDQECFNSILNRMTEPDRDSRYRAELEAGYHPFITGLKKLAGAQGQPGLLCEASAWLVASPPLSELRTRRIECHAVAVSKVALLYASGAQGQTDRRVSASQLTVCYPADLPADCENDFEPLLFAERLEPVTARGSANLTFFVPNSGFVFGGDMFGSVCRGLDCSAFLSHCIQSPMRLDTSQLEQVVHSFAPNGPPVTGLLAQVAAGLEVVPSEAGSLRTGDIILWRGDSSGHVALYEAWADVANKKFFAIDASRWGEGSESRDGVATAELSIFREDKKTYILRSRTASHQEVLC